MKINSLADYADLADFYLFESINNENLCCCILQ